MQCVSLWVRRDSFESSSLPSVVCNDDILESSRKESLHIGELGLLIMIKVADVALDGAICVYGQYLFPGNGSRLSLNIYGFNARGRGDGREFPRPWPRGTGCDHTRGKIGNRIER
jgi:hypothetical protein